MIGFDQTLIARAANGLYNMQVGNATMDWALEWVNGGNGSVYDLANLLYARDFGSMEDAEVAAMIVENVNITGAALVAEGIAFVTFQLGLVAPDQKGAQVINILNAFADFEEDAVYGPFVDAFNAQITAAVEWAQTPGTIDLPLDQPESMEGKVFTLTPTEAAGADAMRLTGDQDVRIDFTNPANQVTGLDLDGDGVIEFDGQERSVTGVAADFEIVDAYARNPLNHTDSANNFLGDIEFDGTGFNGDGTNTDGNIFLGGLGADQALGGIGNDFLAGGGVAQGHGGNDYLSGGRNADFFFVELSRLSATDGNNIRVDGGTTADDTVAATGTPGGLGTQDIDWIMLEASDDDEPVTITLNEGGTGSPTAANNAGTTASGRVFHMWDVESINASGNLYSFLNDFDTTIGARAYDGYGDEAVAGEENYGRGSTAQLVIGGSTANNAIIGGYDNDAISGEDGDDLLMGGDLRFLLSYKNNPNLLDDNGGLDLTANAQGLVFDGKDNLFGGTGNDNIVFESDNGTIDGGADTGKTSGNFGGVDDRPYVGPRFQSQGDTLWLTDFSAGRLAGATLDEEGTAQTDALAALTTDSVYRVDLGGGNNFKNYGGTAVASQDTTNYAGTSRVTMSGMESVNATGLGAVDYKAAGKNDPELTFSNQQNYSGLEAQLDLRGSGADNALLSSRGNDSIEGRGGDDVISGGAGNDRIVVAFGDGVDWLARPVDANGDNLWDTTGGLVVASGVAWGQDFRPPAAATAGTTTLVVDFGTTLLNGNDTFVATFQVRIDGEDYGADIPIETLAAAKSITEVAKIVNESYQEQNPNVSAVANTSNNSIEVRAVDSTPEDGKLPEIGTTAQTGFFVSGQASGVGTFQAAGTILGLEGTNLEDDRLVIKSYDGADGRSVNLGLDQTKLETSQAADMVVNLTSTGSQLAEGQAVRLYLDGIKEGDIVTVEVNGAKYSYKAKAGEDSEDVATNLAAAITNFLDVNSASGQLTPTASLNSFGDTKDLGGNQAGVLIEQAIVQGSQVFMNLSATVTRDDGVGAFGTVLGHNNSDTMVQLLGFDGRNGALYSQDKDSTPVVLFQGRNTGTTTTSMLLTGKNVGGDLKGMDANMVAFDPLNDPGAGNRWINGDDLLIGGTGNDNILPGTGDDVVLMSAGKDTVDGGGNITAVKDVSYGEKFQDVLIAQEGTFGTGTNFTVTLDGAIDKTGAGTVEAFDAKGVTTGSVTTFTNLELVRVLENNRNSTLDLKALSDNIALAVGNDSLPDEGLDVLLTRTGGTTYSIDDNDNGLIEDPPEIRTTTAVLGTENITTGKSNDRVTLDQTQANANNKINLDGEQDNTILLELRKGQDVVTYDHRDINNDGVIDVADKAEAKPSLTIAVTDTSKSTVSITGGALGSAKTTDTLTGVEVVDVTDAATGARFNDTIDVSGLTDAVVNYGPDLTVGKSLGGQITPETTVAKLDGNTLDQGGIALASKLGTELLVIDDIALMERVTGSAGDDRVIIADTMQVVAAGSFAAAAGDRFTFFDQNTDTATGLNATKALRADQGLYRFDLGAGSNDSVDYDDEDGTLLVSVNTKDATDQAYVDNRIDYVTNVERYFASTDNSDDNWIDLAAATVPTTVQFSKEAKSNVPANEYPEPNGNDGTTTTGLTRTAEVRSTADNTVFANFVDRTAASIAGAGAWLHVFGSNLAENVLFTDNETALPHELLLQGGLNRVDYTALTATITAEIGAVDTTVRSLTQDSKVNGDDDVQQMLFSDFAANVVTFVGSSRSGDTINVAGLDANRVMTAAGDVAANTSEVDPQFNVVDLAAGRVTEAVFGQYTPVGSTAVLAAAFPTFVSGFENATNAGSAQVVHLLGDGGRNSLAGGLGDDVIYGGRGTAGDGSADVGAGNRGDNLTGGLGSADTFLYRAEAESPAGAVNVEQASTDFGGSNINLINSRDTIADFVTLVDTLAFTVPDSYSSVKVVGAIPAVLAANFVSADPAVVTPGATTFVTLVNDNTLASVPARAANYAIDFTAGTPVLGDVALIVSASSGSDTIDASAGLNGGNLNAAPVDGLSVEVVYSAASQSQAGGFDSIVNFSVTGEDKIDLSFLKLPRYESTQASSGIDFDTNDDNVVDAAQEGNFAGDGAVRLLTPSPVFSANSPAPNLFLDDSSGDTIYKPIVMQVTGTAGNESTNLFIDRDANGNYEPGTDMIVVLVGVGGALNLLPATPAGLQDMFVFNMYGGAWGG